MAYLWMRDTNGSWTPLALMGASLDVSVTPPRPIEDGMAPQALLLKCGSGAEESWALAADSGTAARINGALVVAGLGVLSDRDELRVNGSASMYFSTERLAVVEPFHGSGTPVCCGRCRQQLSEGDPAVRCPGCGVWYNQSAEYPCWTYHDTCAFCPQPTALDAGFRWVPED